MESPPASAASALLERARQLKAACYAAWQREPSEAVRCAEELALLAAGCADDDTGTEVRGLAAWTGAIADLARGDPAAAADGLVHAHDLFLACDRAAEAAQTRVPLVMALSLLGRFEEAESAAIAARDAFVAQGDLGAAARVVLNLGSLCYSRDRYEEAARHYERAAIWFARVGDREHSILADLGRGDACSYLGDLDEAEALYRRASQRALAHGQHVTASSAAQALAELALVRGQYGEALTGLAQASERFTTLGLAMERLEAEKALADTYLELHLLAEADALYADVLAGLDDGSATKAWAWLQRARVAALAGDPVAARQGLREADLLFSTMDNAVGLASTRIAGSALDLGEGAPERAVVLAHEARQLLDAQGLPVAHATLAIAAAEAMMGAGQQAILRLESLLDDPATPLPLRERAFVLRGQALLGLGARAAAQAAFERAVELAEAGLRRLPTDEVQRAYLDVRSGAYAAMLAFALEEHAAAEPAGEASTATSAWAVVEAMENLRARTLRLQLGAGAVTFPVQVARDPVSDDARTRLDWVYRRLDRHFREGADDPAPARLEEERRALEARLLERHRRVRLASSGTTGDVAETAAGSTAATAGGAARLAALGARLARGAAVVAYGLAGDEVFATVVVDERAHVVRRLSTLPALHEATRALRRQLDTQRLGTAHLVRHAPLLQQRVKHCLGVLHDLLWRPLAATLPQVDEVRIVPGGALGSLPFAALWDGERYLVERHRACILPSVELALEVQPCTRPASAVMFADTQRLHGAAIEAAAFAEVWPHARVLQGDALTCAAARGALADAALVHVACHGEFRADAPQFSALHLADGALTAFDIQGLRLARAPLVVLSACETARADVARGDEAIGLVRAFLVAGASRVIATQWSIDDAVTAEWMRALHAELAAGSSVSMAVSRIQKRYIAAGAHPYHWAAFAVHGGN